MHNLLCPKDYPIILQIYSWDQTQLLSVSSERMTKEVFPADFDVVIWYMERLFSCPVNSATNIANMNYLLAVWQVQIDSNVFSFPNICKYFYG